ncbi:hypothetical protein AIN02nite_16990 [Acetobacter indonesiensis]|uniref:Uncharacterized protein n=1 Tax=Acetobacter indonesiensis TaxID=104101 RepID=A0A6N3T6W2_9PROT|nr:hypothetical protein AIN02nite_16990 [Acetobacter indonesiensis]
MAATTADTPVAEQPANKRLKNQTLSDYGFFSDWAFYRQGAPSARVRLCFFTYEHCRLYS